MINQEIYEELKSEVSGFYYKFNTQVQRFYIHKLFKYEDLINTAKDFDNFEDFYNFHTENKLEEIIKTCKKMYEESISKNIEGTTMDKVEKCLIVRLGNIYNGIYTENIILNTLSNLTEYIICEKSTKDTDMNYKVDGVLEIIGLGKIAFQIKPNSFTKYDNGSELRYHNEFKNKFGIKVFYIYYLDKEKIKINNKILKLDNKNDIIEQIEYLLINL